MDNRYKSDIPGNADESIVSPYRVEDGHIYYEEREYILDGVKVGSRFFDKDGSLIVETPIKNGMKHRMEYSWDDDSSLSLAEPYHKGLVHGTAQQWDPTGALMGTYTLTHGTGYDIWRHTDWDGGFFVAEIHPMKDGLPHGFEWWLNKDLSLHEETHRKKGPKQRKCHPEGACD